MTENDSTVKADGRLPPGESGIGSLPSGAPAGEDAQPGEEAKLDLLLPKDLPIEHPLNAAERLAMRHLLMRVLHALQLPDRAASLRQLDELLRNLKETEDQPARVTETSTPVNAAQVDDFDSYFRVDRITSNDPALSLVRGLLQTSRAVMALFCRADHLSPRHVEQQIAGFVAYTHLLARTFELGELT